MKEREAHVDDLFNGDAVWLEVPVTDQCCFTDRRGERCRDEIDRHIVIKRADGSLVHISACFGHFEEYRVRARQIGWLPMVDRPVVRQRQQTEPSSPRSHVDGVPVALANRKPMQMKRRQH